MEYELAVAKTKHIDVMVELSQAAYAEGPETSPMSLTRVRRYIGSMVRNEHQLTLVALVDNVPQGLIIGEVSPHAFSTGLVASDTVIYVSPALRGCNAAKDLITAYGDWCGRIPNLIGSTLGISQLGASTQYLDAIYRSLGYKRIGITYLRKQK